MFIWILPYEIQSPVYLVYIKLKKIRVWFLAKVDFPKTHCSETKRACHDEAHQGRVEQSENFDFHPKFLPMVAAAAYHDDAAAGAIIVVSRTANLAQKTTMPLCLASGDEGFLTFI